MHKYEYMKEKTLERMLKALANKRRLAIIRYLKLVEEAYVGDIADEIGLSFKSTSRHLVVLASADILEKDQRGLQIFYRLSSPQDSPIKEIVSVL